MAFFRHPLLCCFWCSHFRPYLEDKEEENVENEENIVENEEENVENEEENVENEEENVENEKYPNNNWMLCIDFVLKLLN